MVVFTADWHINLRKDKVPSTFQYKRWYSLIKQLKANNLPMIIGGDIFDKYPTLEELSLFVKLVTEYDNSVVIYDGNHEARNKRDTFFTELKDILAPLSNLTIITEFSSIEVGNLNFDVLPYNQLGDLGSITPNNKHLLTHVRGDIPPYVKAETNLDYFQAWEKVFAGDLHATEMTQRNINYPGEPMTINFGKTSRTRGYFLVDESFNHEFVPLELPQLINKTIYDKKDAVETDYDLTLYTLVGDKKKARDANSDLIKSVITETNEDAVFMESSAENELYFYLKEVLGVEDVNRLVSKAIEVFEP